jgi:CDP-paratose 2-epimerase
VGNPCGVALPGPTPILGAGRAVAQRTAIFVPRPHPGHSGAGSAVAETMLDTPRRILITGGAGFIGCNLADRLSRKGHHVVVLDDLSRRGSELNLSWLRVEREDPVEFIRADIRDAQAMRAAMQGVEVVYHLAAQTAVTTSVIDPRLDFDINALGTFNVLEAARISGQNPAFVFASTNKVYGEMHDVAVEEQDTRHVYTDLAEGADETYPLDFHSPYGCSKGSADQYVRDYHRIYGLPTVVFRQSCIYGPRQMGVEDQGWVAWFVIAAATGKPITIYGDGKQVRDLLYVDDLVDAYEGAVQNIGTTAGQVYNMGGGRKNTMSIWAEFQPILSEVLGRRVEAAAFAGWRPGDQKVFYCDTSRAGRDFGWAPKTGVRDGIAQLAEWVLANRGIFGQHGEVA